MGDRVGGWGPGKKFPGRWRPTNASDEEIGPPERSWSRFLPVQYVTARRVAVAVLIILAIALVIMVATAKTPEPLGP